MIIIRMLMSIVGNAKMILNRKDGNVIIIMVMKMIIIMITLVTVTYHN